MSPYAACEKHKLLLKWLRTILETRTAVATIPGTCRNSTTQTSRAKVGMRKFRSNHTNMKTKLIVLGLAACLVLTSTAGCKTESAASQTAQQAAGAASAQGLLDKARSLIADQRYQEAQTILNQLSSLSLSPDQQKLVTELETQVQTPWARNKRGVGRLISPLPNKRFFAELWPQTLRANPLGVEAD
jgi:hypothetical protein